MARLSETQDPRGLRVICTVERFEEHILRDSRHTELRGHEASLEATIRDLLAMYRDVDCASREVYYRPSDLAPPHDRGFLRAVVEFAAAATESRTGLVVTAYHAFLPKPDEVLLWSRT